MIASIIILSIFGGFLIGYMARAYMAWPIEDELKKTLSDFYNYRLSTEDLKDILANQSNTIRDLKDQAKKPKKEDAPKKRAGRPKKTSALEPVHSVLTSSAGNSV